MQNTSGFYKKEDNVLLFGPNGVLGPTYELLKQMKDSYNYPIEGWRWFDSVEQAHEYYDI
jgi:hypothetical protein